MLLERLIDSYGYLAILIGTFLEGETIVLIGGIAAKFGHLKLTGVIFAALLGTTVGDQLYFFIGRYYGKSLLRKKPQWKFQVDRIDRLIVKWEVGLVLGFRFMYGLRTVASFTFGMSSISTRKFILLNLLGAVIWAIIIAHTGYFFGKSLEWLFTGDNDAYQLPVFIIILALGISLWLFFYWRNKNRPFVKSN